MERIEIIERAAAALIARQQVENVAGAARVERICGALDLYFQTCPASGVMLGGAYSRLQLWAWAHPDYGGCIWLRDDLDSETRAFAIAHELGHYVLHRGEGVNLRPACDQQAIDQQADSAGLRAEDHVVQEYSPRVRRELEANAFAAELLAPRATVRRLFTADPHVNAERLAHRLGVSRALAARRLIDALLAPARPVDYARAPQISGDGATETRLAPGDLLARLDDGQRAAARTEGPALVVAGPGTGKTATLIGRVAYLVGERDVPPEQVLALTFSNRAAGEMRERLERSGLPGERMPVMTIHAFAATLLREYASRVPHAPDEAELSPDFRILDEANAYLLMEGLLGELPLRYYRSLGVPTAHLNTLRQDFSQARDELLTPAAYHELVKAMPQAPEEVEETHERASGQRGQRRRSQPPEGMYTGEQIGRAHERAAAYAVWDRALRQRGLVDFGGLVQRAVELLRAEPEILAHARARYPQMLVDEFQDTNRAAAELLLLLAGDDGAGLWVVGDQNQSIYRFRGASPRNLPLLVERYPHLHVLTLRRCYRAVPEIVQLGSAMAAQMARFAPANPTGEPTGALGEAMRPVALEAVRPNGAQPAIQRADDFESAAHERVGLAAAIERFHALGYRYSDQVILCRTHKQARQIGAILVRQGVPISQLGDFFERPEVKDALMLLFLAAGPDARGVLRAAPLLACLGYAPPVNGELAAATRALSSQSHPLPFALCDRALLSQIAALSATTRGQLARLGEIGAEIHNGAKVGSRLAKFLLEPGGYAWRLARVSDGLDAPTTDGPLAGMESPARAQQALAALGELVRLAWRFDLRWEREPDFQMRMSRAVTRRRNARPVAPDTLQGAPNADIVPDAEMASPANAPAAHASSPDVAPAVSCFLHYLRALRATDVAVPVPADDEDGVHVLTLHQSKGLEFPVVLLPGLAQGQFPMTSHGREEVCPPGFRPGDTPAEREAEERCLFYVGVTRARDVVAFTRAASYGKSASGGGRAAEPSRLLALLADAPGWRDARPLIPDAERADLRSAAAAFSESDEEDDDEEAGAAPQLDREGARSSERRTFRLRDLEQYHACPRQYKYAAHYGLLDQAQSDIARFHRFIRRGARELRDVQATTRDPDWADAEARLRPLWETDGPAGHAYDAFYWQAAEAILREEWQAITAPDSHVSDRVTLAEELTAHLRHCDVKVTADRVVTDDEGLTILVRLHTGRRREDDKKDLALPLYYLAYQQAHPGARVAIVIAYTGSALDNGSGAGSPGAYDPHNQEDVTDDARKAADKYRDATRKRRSALDKLDEAALGILAGQFAPRPDDRRCPTCPFCYVCPADPEDGRADPMPQPGRQQRQPAALLKTSDADD